MKLDLDLEEAKKVIKARHNLKEEDEVEITFVVSKFDLMDKLEKVKKLLHQLPPVTPTVEKIKCIKDNMDINLKEAKNLFDIFKACTTD